METTIMNVLRSSSVCTWLVSAAALLSLSAVSSGCGDKPLGDARLGLTGTGGDGGMPTGDLTNTDTGTTLTCDQSVGMVGGKPTGFALCDGILHRPQKLTCPNLLPRTQLPHQVTASVKENCKSDADCTAQPNGYCDFSSGLIGSFWSCQYGCLSDQDCGAGSVCRCGDPVGTCHTTTCVTDGDCAPGKLCAAGSGDSTVAGGSCALRFACQTTTDRCQSRADCNKNGGSGEYCAVTDTGRKCLEAPQDSPCF